MNKMYTPAIYYMARILSGMIIQIFYPIILTLVVFWGLSINTSFYNFFYYLTLSILVNLVGCTLGYMAGVSFDNDESARGLATFLQLIFQLTGGGLNNAATYPPFIYQLQYISPVRYSQEGFFRAMIYGDVPEPAYSTLLERFGFTIGDPAVHFVLMAIMLTFFIIGFFIIVIKNRKL